MYSVPPFDERSLVSSIAADDQQAFAALFEHYRNKIYTVAFSLTDSKQAAEEIVQDVFVKVWLTRKELPAVEKLDAWLFIIARNMIFSFLRREAVKAKNQRHAAVGLLPSGSPQEAFDKLDEKELRGLLLQAVDQLSTQQKQVYLLSKEEGMKQQKIAEQLNIAPQTVKKHLQYAMRNIRAYIVSRGGVDFVLLLLWKIS